jgi:hypothetical protein
MYNNTLAGKLAAIQGQVQSGTAEYQRQISQAPSTYQPMRNETYTNDQLAQRALRERLANMGLGASGGKSLTLENQREMSLQNKLGDINRQQQKFIDDANFQIAQLQNQGRYQEAQAVAEVAAQMNQALQEDYWQRQEQKEAQTDRYYQMFLNKNITAAQFKKLTGISVQRARSGRRKQKDNDNDVNKWFKETQETAKTLSTNPMFPDIYK